MTIMTATTAARAGTAMPISLRTSAKRRPFLSDLIESPFQLLCCRGSRKRKVSSYAVSVDGLTYERS
jgi:hypothetical protein